MMARKLSIHVHPILVIFIIISLLTGMFLELMIIFSIVFIHEMGHYRMAKYFGWRVNRVVLWVFGGVMETDEHGNRPLKEELFVTLAGPVQHIFIYMLLILSGAVDFLPEAVLETAYNYNTAILLFNLLPIWPLDGGKILFLILSIIVPFKRALDWIFLSSLIMCVVFIVGHLYFFTFTLTFTLIMVFLYLENRLEWKRRFYIFIRFLMDRYERNQLEKKLEPVYVPGNLKLMDVFHHFKREKKHVVIFKKKTKKIKEIDETDCLHAYFHKKHHREQLQDLF